MRKRLLILPALIIAWLSFDPLADLIVLTPDWLLGIVLVFLPVIVIVFVIKKVIVPHISSKLPPNPPQKQ